MDKYWEELTGESWFSIQRSKKSLSIYIHTYINLLSQTVAEKYINKNNSIIAWRERKVNKHMKEPIGQNRFSIQRYNLSLLFCIPNMNFLSYTVVVIPLTKYVERKKKG